MAPSATECERDLADQLKGAVCRKIDCDPDDLQRFDCGSEVAGTVAYGFLSTCGSVTVEAVTKDRVHKLHLFVKREDPGLGDLLVDMDPFPKEAFFYNSIRPLLESAWTRGRNSKDAQSSSPDLGPAPYLGTNSVIVLDDLTQCGFSSLGNDWARKGLDFQTVEQTMRAFARLHAASLLATHRDGVDFPAVAPSLLEENFFTQQPGHAGRRLLELSARSCSKIVLPRVFHRLSVPQTAEELRRLQDEAHDAFRTLDMEAVRREERVLVVCHGDSWPNNVLVRRDAQGRAEHAALVDFQMVRWAPPACDVVMFLHTAMTRAGRRRHMDALVRGYYKDLAAFTAERGLDLGKILSLDDFLESVRRMMVRGRVIAMTYLHVNANQTQEFKDLFKDGEKRKAFIIDEDTRLGCMAKWYDMEDEDYRRILQDLVEDLLDLPSS